MSEQDREYFPDEAVEETILRLPADASITYRPVPTVIPGQKLDAPTDLPTHMMSLVAEMATFESDRMKGRPASASGSSGGTGSSSGSRGGSSSGVSRESNPMIPVPGPDSGFGFQLQRIIGRGGVGEVWEAIQRRLSRTVAVKRLRKRKPHKGALGSDPSSTVRAFHGEALTAALLEHPNIVPVYDLGYDADGAPLIAMKYVRGVEWQKELDRDFRELDVDSHLAKHLPVLIQVAQAVAFAHSRGIIHRDLKPSQVMVGEFGEVLLMDWGLAIMLEDPPEAANECQSHELYPTLATASNPAGTPAYMAPEQTETSANRLGTWTDVYLLGGVLFAILTGVPPHPSESSRAAFMSAAAGRVLEPWSIVGDRHIPEELLETAMAALHPNPDERLPSAKLFIERVKDYLSGASRRRESREVVAQVSRRIVTSEARSYADFATDLDGLSRAQMLWPDNPAVEPLREEVLAAYAENALEHGDLRLAEAQIEQLMQGPMRLRLSARVAQGYERQRRQRRRVRQFGIAAGLLLVAVLAGGAIFSGQLRQAYREIASTLAATETSRAAAVAASRAEAEARARAQRELDRSTLLLANSLIGSNRNQDALRELLSIPEERRNWEWGYMAMLAMPDLWTLPLRVYNWSPSGSIAFAFHRDEGLGFFDAETGETIRTFGGNTAPTDGFAVFDRSEKYAFLGGAGLKPTIVHIGSDTLVSITLPDGEVATAAAFAPDGRSVAIGTSTGTVTIRDTDTGADRGTPYKAPHRIQGVQIGANGRTLAASTPYGYRMLDLNTGATISELGYITDAYFGATVDFRQRYLALKSRQHPGVLIDLDAGTHTQLPDPVLAYGFYPRGGDVAVLTYRDSSLGVSVWNPEGAAYRKFAESNVRFNQSGEFAGAGRYDLVVSRSERSMLVLADGEVLLGSLGNLTTVGRQEFDSNQVRAISLSDWSGAARLSLTEGITSIRDLSQPYVGPRIQGQAPSFAADSRYAKALRWSWAEEQCIDSGEFVFQGARNFGAYRGLSASPDRQFMTTVGYRHGVLTVERAKMGNSETVATLTFPEQEFAGFRLSPDTEFFYTISPDRSLLTQWSVPRQEVLWDFSLDDGTAIAGAIYSPDSQKLAIVLPGGDVLLRRIESGDDIVTIKPDGVGAVQTILWSPTSEQLTLGLSEGTIRSYTIDGNPLGAPLQSPDGAVSSLTLSPSGRYLIQGGKPGSLWLWDLAKRGTKTHVNTGDFPWERVRVIAEESRLVLQAGNQARVYDIESGTEVLLIDGKLSDIDTSGTQLLLTHAPVTSTVATVAPYRTPPGSRQTVAEELERWRLERYRSWFGRRVREAMPTAFQRIRADNRPLREELQNDELLLILLDTLEQGAAEWDGARLIRLEYFTRVAFAAERAGILRPARTWGFAMGELERYGIADRVPGSREAAAVTTIRSVIYAKGSSYYSPWVLASFGALDGLQAVAELCERRGDREDAIALMRYVLAMRALVDEPSESALAYATRLGIAPPMSPAPDIVTRGYQIPTMLISSRDRLAGYFDAYRRIQWDEVPELQAFRTRIEEYLHQNGAVPDFEAIIDRLIEDFPGLTHPLDGTVVELFDEISHEVEVRESRGRTLRDLEREAIEEFDRRFAGVGPEGL